MSEVPPDEFFGDEPATMRPPPKRNLRVVAPDEAPRLPDILLGPEIHKTTDEISAALVVDPELYRRAGELTHVIRDEPLDTDKETRVRGTPITRAMPLSMLINRVSKYTRVLKWNAKSQGWVHVTPPPPHVKAVLEQGAWPGIRELRGIVESPSLKPDGTVLQTPGYDAQTGFLYEPNAAFPPVPDQPTHSECVVAYARLLEPFKDFPYVDDAHRAAAVAGILTLLARPAIKGSVPCWLFDASAARSGKSLQTDVISLVVSGRSASRMTFPENDEELEKVLSSYAMRGASVVNFDNVARPFGGAALDKVITAVDKVDLRVLGSTDLRTMDWLAVVFASGNNVTCKGDMLARVLSPRLETPLDNPEKRTDLTYPDLRAWVAANRTDLAVAALTILRGYIVAGSPDQGCPRWGGFEAWSRLIPHALVWVGARDPMGARRGLAGDQDPERMAASGLLAGWERLCFTEGCATAGLSLKQALAVLYPQRKPGVDDPPDGHEELREVIELATDSRPGQVPSTRRLGEFLRKLKSRPIGGKKLEAPPPGDGRVAKWRVRPA